MELTCAQCSGFAVVPPVGVEPTLLAELDFESSASTNSATGATQGLASSEAAGWPQQPAASCSGENFARMAALRILAEAVWTLRPVQTEEDEQRDGGGEGSDPGNDHEPHACRAQAA